MYSGHLAITVPLAWRSVWRNRRRTVLTLLTITVGSAMIILLNALATGGHEQMIEDAVAANTGHIQIHEKGFQDNQSGDYAFIPDRGLLSFLDHSREISSFSKRVHAGGLIASGDTTVGALIQGVEPAREQTVTSLHRMVLPGGRYLADDDKNTVVMGSVLAKNLGVKTGDVVSMLGQAFDGSIAAGKFIVAGLFASGNPEYDRSLVLMPFESASRTFAMMGYVNSITVRLTNPSLMNDVRDSIRDNALDASGTGELEVMGWDELMPELVQFIIMDDVSAYIFDFILFMIVAFGILNTIQMSVFERTREFGIMLAIGTSPGQVTAMVLVETLFISLIGTLLGLALGSAAGWYFAVHPIDYSDYAAEMSVWGVSTTIFPAKITSFNMVFTFVFTMILSVLFAYFPARRASKLSPVEAIRHL